MSVPFELITLYMGTISVLLVIEIAPWNFLLTYIETDQNGWKTSYSIQGDTESHCHELF